MKKRVQQILATTLLVLLCGFTGATVAHADSDPIPGNPDEEGVGPHQNSVLIPGDREGNEPPQVIKTTPENNALVNSNKEGIWIKFNMPMDSNTVVYAIEVRRVIKNSKPISAGSNLLYFNVINVVPFLGRPKTDQFFITFNFDSYENVGNGKYIVCIRGHGAPVYVDDYGGACGEWVNKDSHPAMWPPRPGSSVAKSATGAEMKEDYFFSYVTVVK